MGDSVLSKEASLARLAAAQAAKAAADALAGGPLGQVEQHRNWPLLSQLPLKLNVAVPMPGFKVRDLLALGAGKTIASLWKVSEDVPLRVGGVAFGWGEFEVIEQKLALRMTRLG
jgi:flagellar motor switch protein FliN/FliY